MAKGNYGALKQLTPDNNRLGDIARQQEQTNMKRDALKKQDARQKKSDDRQALDDQQKRIDRDTNLLKNHKNVYTGIDSVDKGLGYGFEDAARQILETDEALRKDPDNLDLKLKAANLQNYTENLKQITQKQTAHAQKLITGIADGTLSKSQNKTALADLSNIYAKHNFKAGVGANGMPTIDVAQFDGDRFIDDEEITHQQFFDNSYLKDGVEAVDVDKWMKDLDLGIRGTLTEGDDYSKTNIKRISDEANVKIANDIEGFIGTKEDPSAVGKGIWEDHYGEKAGNYSYDKLKEKLTNDAKSTANTSFGKTTDGAQKARDDKAAKDAAEKAKETPRIISSQNSQGKTRKGEIPYEDKLLNNAGVEEANLVTLTGAPSIDNTPEYEGGVDFQNLAIDKNGNLVAFGTTTKTIPDPANTGKEDYTVDVTKNVVIKDDATLEKLAVAGEFGDIETMKRETIEAQKRQTAKENAKPVIR